MARGRSSARSRSAKRSRRRSSSARRSVTTSIAGNGSAANGIGQYNSTGGIVTYKGGKKLSKAAKKSFKRKQRSIVALQPPQTFLRNFSQNQTVATTTQAVVATDPMFSLSGTANDFDDIQAICATTVMGATGQTWPTDSQYTKRMFIGCRQEMEVTNTGSNLMYLDIYDYVLKKDVTEAAPSYLVSATPSQYWNQDSGAQATLSTIGVTPFDCRYVTDCCKITKVTKYQVEPGQSVMIVRHVKPRYLDAAKALDLVSSNSQFGLKGWTRGQIMVSVGKCDSTQDAEPLTWTYLSIKRYNVKLIPGVITAPTMTILA